MKTTRLSNPARLVIDAVIERKSQEKADATVQDKTDIPVQVDSIVIDPDTAARIKVFTQQTLLKRISRSHCPGPGGNHCKKREENGPDAQGRSIAFS